MTDYELISRDVLFGNPDRNHVRISPEGERIAYLAPRDGVMNVFVGPLSDPEAAEPVTDKSDRGPISFYWAYTGNHILYPEDDDGNENYHLHCVNLETGADRDLTPYGEIQVQLQRLTPRHPEQLLVLMNRRDPEVHDVFRVSITGGEPEMVLENDRRFQQFVSDRDLRVRFGQYMEPDGTVQLLQRRDDEWEDFQTITPEDHLNTSPLGVDSSGTYLYMTDSRNRDTSALVRHDLETGERKVLAENENADAGDVLLDPASDRPMAVSFQYQRRTWTVVDEEVSSDFQTLRDQMSGDLRILDQTENNDTWVVADLKDDGPVEYYRYDRDRQDLTFLFVNRDDLQDRPLVRMQPEIITSRDGLDMVSYLHLPPGTERNGSYEGEPLPAVLTVHGGPWARNTWGYNPRFQWLANRGYAVITVNFRGSTGFGKSFLNAGDGEWAGKMHDDLIDAVDWAVEEGVADPERIGIYGGSYGGYAVLVGLTFTPDVFACGICVAGPSSLLTLIKNIPPYWAPMIPMLKRRVGADPSTEEGREYLLERSPISRVDDIKKPLLMGYGANDPRVKKSEAEQFVDALEEKDVPVTYALFPDEGHGFVRSENRLAMSAVAESFLSEHLGGRMEPITDDVRESSLKLEAGSEHVPGLEDET